MTGRDPWFGAGLLAGALIAIAVVWLLAPETGRDLFERLKREFLRTRAEAREAGRQAQSDILDRYRDVRAKAVAPPGGDRDATAARPGTAAPVPMRA